MADLNEWQTIETAPSGWVRVSMRDVDREPPEWVARRMRYFTYGRGRKHRPIERECWVAKDDGLICAPTHWMPAPPTQLHPPEGEMRG